MKFERMHRVWSEAICQILGWASEYNGTQFKRNLREQKIVLLGAFDFELCEKFTYFTYFKTDIHLGKHNFLTEGVRWVRWNVKCVINFLWSMICMKKLLHNILPGKCSIFYAFSIKVHMVQVKQLHVTTKDFPVNNTLALFIKVKHTSIYYIKGILFQVYS